MHKVGSDSLLIELKEYKSAVFIIIKIEIEMIFISEEKLSFFIVKIANKANK